MEESKEVGASPDADATHINLRFVAQDGSVIHFKVKPNISFKKVFTDYCSQTNVAPNAARFFHRWRPVLDHESPMDLRMDERDAIAVFVDPEARDDGNHVAKTEVTKESEAKKAPEEEGPMGPDMEKGGTEPQALPASETQFINLKITDLTGKVVHFKMKKHSLFGNAMTAYCKHVNVERDMLRFIHKGQMLWEGDTPMGLHLKEEDNVEVFVIRRLCGS